MFSKRTSFFASVLSLSLLSGAAHAIAPQVQHPLDALTPQEYWTIYKTVRAEGHMHEKTIFASILLHEPDKKMVLAWKATDPIPRKADVVILDAGKSYATVVDIAAKKLEDFHELKGEQAPFTSEEGHEVEEAIKHDPQVIAALAKRNITDLRHVYCYATPAGFIDLPEQKDPSRRIGWGGCILGEDAVSGQWDREIGGIFTVVDMQTKKVLRVSDLAESQRLLPRASMTGWAVRRSLARTRSW